MICRTCRNGVLPGPVVYGVYLGDLNLHRACRGGNWCDCQHKIGTELIAPLADQSHSVLIGGKGLARPVVDSTSNQPEETQ